ncbi:hypothetical protein [Microbacterium sp. VKM Ac-2923]|uniref:hypothetical protein n=1 Tax=Microbacterium sp. VKM Ac-2923 TaxID=2929476 RepID=UPI001FB1F722|nr:hypothetical protein [Microbacterium sp. VKM Ac-2923]MCJ1709256.1 hypothetical protein [Microbacterium sp. VKM Ac-2923]
MARLAIADPPYYRRGERWYGNGNGDWSGNGTADVHPEAGIWDSPGAHIDLVQRLTVEYDGWAIALSPDSLALYLAACPPDVHVMVWHRRNGMPGGNRVRRCWEPVILRQPADRRGRGVVSMTTSDVLDAPAGRPGFAGAKPASWTRWVLDALGYAPGADTLDDLFPGSGAVSAAADGMLALVSGSSDRGSG